MSFIGDTTSNISVPPNTSQENNSKMSPAGSSDATVIDIDPDYCINGPTLRRVVREKNREKLDELGGVEGIASSLKSNVHDGINGDDAEDTAWRIQAYGKNKYHKPPRKCFFRFVWKACQDPKISTLLACATIALGFGIKGQGTKEGWYDGGSMFVAVFLVISVSAIRNFRQSRLFDNVGSSNFNNNIDIEVVRNGRSQQIKMHQIVVGDVTCLKIGDQVPADGLFLNGDSLHVYESLIISETDQVEINRTQNPFLISGSKVADGYGRMLVTSVGMNTICTSVGMNTIWEETMASHSLDSADKTRHQNQLNKLSSAMTIAGAVLVSVADVVCYLTRNKKCKSGHNQLGVSNVLVEFIATAVNTALAAIPGGLPVVFTLILSYSLSRLTEAKAMVPKLFAFETMNSISIICIDKSGTLTQNPCKKAVKDCHDAGVNIKMITGDNISLAKAIAIECGIVGPNHNPNDGSVVEGAEFRNYTDDERMEKVDKVVVMASSSPSDKDLMVKSLKQKGHVVAIISDGTNDVQALKGADIRFLTEVQGTEVAKGSADIIIVDENISSVVSVLRWGRCIYNNIQKFTQFQLTANISWLVINFVTAVSVGTEPITPLEVLWVNLIISSLGALALATERPTKEQMKKPQVGRSDPLITNIMWRNLLGQAFYQIGVILALQFRGKSIFGVSEKVNDTLVYNTFVLCQVFNAFNVRRLERMNIFEGIHRNKFFLGMVGITITVQLVVVEFLKRFADTERLDWVQWAVCAGIGAASWLMGLLVKLACSLKTWAPFQG